MIEYYHRGVVCHLVGFNIAVPLDMELIRPGEGEIIAANVNFILTLFIAFVLLQSFYLRNLKPQRRIHLTLIGLSDELYVSVILFDTPAPWLDKGG